MSHCLMTMYLCLYHQLNSNSNKLLLRLTGHCAIVPSTNTGALFEKMK